MVMGPRSMRMEKLHIKVNTKKANAMVKESHTVMMEQRNMKASGNRTKWKVLEHIGLKRHMTTIRKNMCKLNCSKNMRESGNLENTMAKALSFTSGEAKHIKVRLKMAYTRAMEPHSIQWKRKNSSSMKVILLKIKRMVLEKHFGVMEIFGKMVNSRMVI